MNQRARTRNDSPETALSEAPSDARSKRSPWHLGKCRTAEDQVVFPELERIWRLAQKLANGGPCSDVQDLYQVGVVTAYRMVPNWEKEKSRFYTYIYPQVRQAMVRQRSSDSDHHFIVPTGEKLSSVQRNAWLAATEEEQTTEERPPVISFTEVDDEEGSPAGALSHVALNRRQSLLGIADDLLGDPMPTAETLTAQREDIKGEYAAIDPILDSVGPETRRVYLMCGEQGYSLAAAAKRYKLSYATVKRKFTKMMRLVNEALDRWRKKQGE